MYTTSKKVQKQWAKDYKETYVMVWNDIAIAMYQTKQFETAVTESSANYLKYKFCWASHIARSTISVWYTKLFYGA